MNAIWLRRIAPVIVGGEVPVAYIFRDLFTTDRAAGAVNGTNAEPGPGTRIVGADTMGLISISGGVVRIVGVEVSTSDPRVTSGNAITRAAGQLAAMKFKIGTGKALGFAGTITGTTMHAGVVRDATENGTKIQYGVVPKIMPDVLLDGITYELIVLMRAAGDAIYLNDGSWPQLLYVTPTTTGDPQIGTRPAVAALDLDVTLDDFRAPDGTVTLPVLVSDSFNRADGALAGSTTDGAGHAEANSGSGKAWADRLGISAVVSNRAGFSALDGGSGIGLATAESGKLNQWVQANLYRSAGNVGVVVRYADNDNYLRVYHDGANVKADSVNAGAATNIMSVARAYADGALLFVRIQEQMLYVVYNDFVMVNAGTPLQGAFNLTGTGIGIYSTNTGNTVDNFYSVDSELSTALLTPTQLAKTRVFCVGDSMTSGLMASDGYINRLQKDLGDSYICIDEGRTGGKTAEILTITQNYVANRAPSYVVVLGGTNDLTGSIAEQTIKDNLQAIYTACKNAGAKVIGVTILPRGASTGWTAEKQTTLDNVNAWILDSSPSGAQNVDYRVNAYTPLEDDVTPDNLEADYATGDGLHPNAAGYVVLADTIYSAVTWS